MIYTHPAFRRPVAIEESSDHVVQGSRLLLPWPEAGVLALVGDADHTNRKAVVYRYRGQSTLNITKDNENEEQAR